MSTDTLSETNSAEGLLLYLERLPQGRYEYYIESKNLYGYSSDLNIELKLLLKELQDSEKESLLLRQKFTSYIEETQKIQTNKEQELSFLQNEVEKNIFIIKTIQTHNKEIMQINESKDEKIERLNSKIEDLDNTIHELNSEIQTLQAEQEFYRSIFTEPQIWNSNKIFLNFIEEYITDNREEVLKEKPGLFCKCLGTFETLQAENLLLKQKNEDLTHKILDYDEKYSHSQEKLVNCEQELKSLKKQNQKLSADFKKVIEKKGQFLAEMHHEILRTTRKTAEKIRMGSFSFTCPKKEIDEQLKSRTPASRNMHKKPYSLGAFLEKTEAEPVVQKDISLLNDLENSFGKSLDDKSFNEPPFEKSLEEGNSHQKKSTKKLSLISAAVVNEKLMDSSEGEGLKVINCSSSERTLAQHQKRSVFAKRDFTFSFDGFIYLFFMIISIQYRFTVSLLEKRRELGGFSLRYAIYVIVEVNRGTMHFIMKFVQKLFMGVFFVTVSNAKLILGGVEKTREAFQILRLMGRALSLIKKLL